jgi:hypothetical protein
MRKELKKRDGQRFSVTATVSRFGSRNGWTGLEPTILLTDVRDAATGQLLTDHLWFVRGKFWSSVCEGTKVAFDARATPYEAGYRGGKAERLGLAEYRVDWRLERPTRLQVLEQ